MVQICDFEELHPGGELDALEFLTLLHFNRQLVHCIEPRLHEQITKQPATLTLYAETALSSSLYCKFPLPSLSSSPNNKWS